MLRHHESDDAEGVNKPERVYGICVSFVLLFNLTITNFEILRLTAMSPSAVEVLDTRGILRCGARVVCCERASVHDAWCARLSLGATLSKSSRGVRGKQ
jgi:hypothetical protein